MKKMISALTLGLLVISGAAVGQNPHAHRLDSSSLNQQGKLVNLRVEPREQSLNIYLVGKKGAEVRLDKAKLTAKVRGPENFVKQLKVNRKGDHFSIPANEISSRDQGHLEFTTDLENESETFKVDLK